MNTPVPSSAPLPTRPQRLLLGALYLDGPARASALEAWLAETDLDRLDDASHGLLALLYRRLEAEGTPCAHRDRLRGVYRKTWYGNQAFLERLRPELDALETAGLQPLLLGGAAAHLAVYADPGARPVGELEVLVPPDRFPAAADLLAARGWRPVRPGFARGLPRIAAFIPGVVLGRGAGDRLHLRRRALTFCPGGRIDADFRAGAAEVPCSGGTARVLGSSDRLLATLAEGMVWKGAPGCLWVADALEMLRGGGAAAVDWQRVRDLAVLNGLVLPLRDALGFLAAEFGAPMPADTLLALGEVPVDAAAWSDYAALSGPPGGEGVWVCLRRDYRRCLRLAAPGRPRGAVLRYLRVLQARWNVHGVALVPVVGLWRLIRRREGEP